MNYWTQPTMPIARCIASGDPLPIIPTVVDPAPYNDQGQEQETP